MNTIKEFISVLSGESGSLWLRIFYYLCLFAVLALLIFILVMISKVKKGRKPLTEANVETSGPDKGKPKKYVWKDRRRTAIGLPWTFDRYRLTGEKLLIITGFFNIKEEEIMLYRVTDQELTKKLGQRIFGMGTLTVKSSDHTMPIAVLKNIKRPNQVKDLITELSNKEKLAKRVNSSEMLGLHSHADVNGDGIPDCPDVPSHF